MGGAFTIDSAGQGKFGPTSRWSTHIDYSVDERRRCRFATAIRRYYPEMKERAFGLILRAFVRACVQSIAVLPTGSFSAPLNTGFPECFICSDLKLPG